MATTRALLHAPWSTSKVHTALRCPREFHYRYVDKLKPVEIMPETRIGKAIHAALEAALRGTGWQEALASAGEEFQGDQRLRYDTIGQGLEPFLSRINEFRQRRRVSRQLVEFTLAVREDFTPTQFYAGDAFFRGILDLGFVYDDGRIAIVDHKTGVRHDWHTTIEQLEGYAALALAHLRARKFWLGVHWVADAEVEWKMKVDRAAVEDTLLPRVLDNIEAAALAVDDGPRPNPAAWCGRCSYRSICPTAKEARYEPADDYDDYDID